MPKVSTTSARRKEHFCFKCGKGPWRSEADLNRHITVSKDAGHRALRELVRRGELQPSQRPIPAPDIDPEDEDGWMDVDPLEDDALDGTTGDGDDVDAATGSSNTQHAAHLDDLDAAEAGEPVRDVYPSAGKRIRRGRSPHASFEAAREKSGCKFYPFATKVDYDFADWLTAESISSAAFERLMKRDSVRTKLGLSFTTARALDKIIAKIPCKAPWMKTSISVPGLKKRFPVLYRDTRLLTEDMWSRRNVQGRIALQPERLYTDASRTVRMYSNFNTGEWMWRKQRELPMGATVVPITAFQDKTQLCQFIGVESNVAYPMYMTISSIDSRLLRDVSTRTHALAALLPVVNLKGLRLSKAKQRSITHRVIHKAMRIVYAPLREASHTGMELTAANGDVHEGFPILAMEGLDYPEQCLHTGCRRCPKCDTKKDDFAENAAGNNRLPEETLRHVRHAATLGSVAEIDRYLKNHGLNFILEPFWKDWSHVNIHEAMAPDILHQLYQGLVKHLTAWCRAILGNDELDARMSRLMRSFGLRHFDDGISCLQRVSGTEHRAISKQLLCAMASANVDKRVIRAMSALLDFTFMMQYECHSDDTLADAQDVLDRFHANKDVFTELGACADLNFPKLHMLQHYIPSIKLYGSLIPVSTDIGERLHIVDCKNGYRASNKKKFEFPKQMCKWLIKNERMDWLGHEIAHVDGGNYDARKRVDKLQHEPIEYARDAPAHRTLQELTSLHHADGLEDALRDFLQDHIDSEWRRTDTTRRGAAPSIPYISPYLKFPVWYRMKFFTPDLQTLAAKDTRDIAYATPARLRTGADAGDEDAVAGARFSPIFIKEGGELAGVGGTDGLRVAHLRVIFELPPTLNRYLESARIALPGKLAFVQWFTKLGRRDPDAGMFKVSREMVLARGQGAARVRSAAVIEAVDIRRSAFLSPKLGRDTPAIPRELTSDNVLDEWQGDFWVKHHLDRPMFRSML